MQVPLYEIILLFYLRGLSRELNWKDSVPSVIMSASLPKTDTCERPFLCLIGVDTSPVQKSSLPLIQTENIKSQGERQERVKTVYGTDIFLWASSHESTWWFRTMLDYTKSHPVSYPARKPVFSWDFGRRAFLTTGSFKAFCQPD